MLTPRGGTRRTALLASGVLVLSGGTFGVAPASAAARYCQGQLVTIEATASDTTVTGTEGPDVIDGVGRVRITINGLGGDDVICSGPGYQVVVNGGDGDDSLQGGVPDSGGAQSDAQSELNGEAGDDTLLVAEAGTTADGGEGDDHFVVTSGGWPEVAPGPGDDSIDGDHANIRFGGTEGVRIDVAAGVADGEGHDTFNGAHRFLGSPGPDTFIGSDVGDVFQPGTPRPSALNTDTATGGGGNDTIWLARGTVDGGAGDDSVRVADGGTASGGTGDDSVWVGASGTARGGPGRDDLMVQLHKRDSRGVVRLFGDGGADLFFISFLGTSWVKPCVDPGTCRTVVDGGSGRDRVAYTTSGSGMSVDLGRGRARHQDARGPVRGVEEVLGTRFADTLVGDGHANLLDGQEGADVLRGRGGPDRLIGGDGRDRVDGGAGADRCQGEVRRSC